MARRGVAHSARRASSSQRRERAAWVRALLWPCIGIDFLLLAVVRIPIHAREGGGRGQEAGGRRQEAGGRGQGETESGSSTSDTSRTPDARHDHPRALKTLSVNE
jgi:hypothetical protein